MKQFFQLFRRLSQHKVESGLINTAMKEHGRFQCVLVDPAYPQELMAIELPQAVREFVNFVSIDEDKLQVYDSSNTKSLLGGAMRKADTRQEKVEALLGALPATTNVMQCPGEEWIDAVRIRTALEWSFDADSSDNQTLSLIQACIGLEALLGDDAQDEPVVARLADRCAYVLGKSEKERIDIRKRFRRIYEIRSKLVHGRRARINPSDAEQLSAARTMLSDVITEEANRLLRALKAREEKKKLDSPT
jgi:hypothetical protein